MIRRMMILVLGLWLIDDAGSGAGPGGRCPRWRSGEGPTTTPPSITDWQAVGTQGAVSAGGPRCRGGGLEILKRGGNAADAAAATILALSVTDSRSFCFGGEVPILVYDARTKGVTVIAGQGAAPRLATREEFARRGGIPAKGIEAAAVPAALDACLTLLDRFGTMNFAQVVAPTRQLLARPPRREAWHADFARTLDTLVAAEALAYPGGSDSAAGDRCAGAPAGRRRLLSRPDRPPHRRLVSGQRRADPLRRPGHPHHADRGAGLGHLSRPDRLQVRALDPGPLSARGPADPRRLRPQGDGAQPPRLDPHDRRGVEAGPGRPRYLLRRSAVRGRAAGGAPPAGICRQAAGPDRPQARLARAAAGRSPLGQGAARPGGRPGRGGKRRRRWPTHATRPPAWSPTASATWSRPRPAAGRASWPATPASGSAAGCKASTSGRTTPTSSCRANGPRITLSPTLVLRGQPARLAVSVAGGDNQDQMTLQLLLNHIDFGLEPAESVVAPRFMTDHFISSFGQKPPALGQLRINPELGQKTLDALKSLGHRLMVRSGPLSAAPSVISVKPATTRPGVSRRRRPPRRPACDGVLTDQSCGARRPSRFRPIPGRPPP